ncbi:MAG TPA: glycerophosphodiester phosphodiesterase, partial [Armatimonadetes bacterium]|nr:glycerophosphodiester phosphodiesterase [Armatimonadota bacterium]
YAHQRAVPVIAWTINDGETLAGMLDMGVDTIVSDHPDMVLKALCG